MSSAVYKSRLLMMIIIIIQIPVHSCLKLSKFKV